MRPPRSGIARAPRGDWPWCPPCQRRQGITLAPISTQCRAQSARHCGYNTGRSHLAANRVALHIGLRGGGNMDKRKTWREQEQRLVEGWNAANERLREAQARSEEHTSELQSLRHLVC